MDYRLAQQKASRQDSIISWAVAGIFSVVILVVVLLAFLSPLRKTEQSLTAGNISDIDNVEEAAPPLVLVADKQARCDVLIKTALQVSDQDCHTIDRNQVCYGNYTVDAELIPDALEQFAARGDVIPVEVLRSLLASPLNLEDEEWGIAIFKLEAALPRTVPGQNVTFLVFGDTSLENASGDLKAFFFSTGLGMAGCQQMPADGILVRMPDGTGITFQANGVDLTLMGTAVMEAQPGGDMTVSLLEGSGLVSAEGEDQFFGAGHGVKVPLGGDDGLQPVGPPSAPFPISSAALSVGCSLIGVGCAGEEIIPILAEEARAIIQAALGSGAIASGGAGSEGTASGGTAGSGDTSTGGTTGEEGDASCGTPPCGVAYGHEDTPENPPGQDGGGGGGQGGGRGHDK